jgi:alkanesulfonate monooxygenase SsuD/methylene tetrahydromethanopterin reductase-like flavin-dependent oxidoreductase (luciferase family)
MQRVPLAEGLSTWPPEPSKPPALIGGRASNSKIFYQSVLPYRNPMLLAEAAATVDILSGGRFVRGAETGYGRTGFHAVGVDFDERNALFDEALDVLPLHWSDEPFSHSGGRFNAREVSVRPRPPRRPKPIWIGGNSKPTMRRVAHPANSRMPMLGPDALFAATRTAPLSTAGRPAEQISRLRADAGERGAALDVAVAYTDPSLHDAGADFGKHRAAIEELARAGATWVIVPGRGGSRNESVASLQRLGKEVARP